MRLSRPGDYLASLLPVTEGPCLEEAHHRRVVSYLRPEIKPGAVPVLCLCVPKPESLPWDGTCRPPPVLIRPVSASNHSRLAPPTCFGKFTSCLDQEM